MLRKLISSVDIETDAETNPETLPHPKQNSSPKQPTTRNHLLIDFFLLI